MESRYRCDGCSKSFSTEDTFIKHKNVCKTNSIKFKCSYCSKMLSSKQNLKEHEFTHTGELPYICKSPGCGLRFRQGSVLSAHKRIHNTIERYINQEKHHWIKLTDILHDIKETEIEIIEERLEVIELPPIKEPQKYKLKLVFDKFNI
ncbi:hypothetical protein SteCoe_2484 [Stentor coeruleus]|uniref:C2H2-type domain-containing protein n=1 Tax=Stentor coeruleus TaxID=5963 RepID=A0A1R2CZJ8_9CILI|nr:hypothetical protein SteCoe_2484 [Stentor coeruleus]